MSKFFKSSQVKVFPCAYRGTYSNNNKQGLYDPESRLNTEYNMTHIASGTLDSYIISWTEDTSGTNTLACVIGGYYFEITGLSSADFVEEGNIEEENILNLYIKTKEVVLKAEEASGKLIIDKERTTKVLAPWNDAAKLNTDAVYESLDDTQGNFRGICLSSSDLAGYTAKLAVFIKEGSSSILNYNDFLPKVYSGSSSDNTAVRFGDKTTNVASAKNSIAAGEGTLADKDNLVAIGTYNDTKDNDLFVVGNGDSSNKSNILEVNKNFVKITKTSDISAAFETSGIAKISTDNDVELSDTTHTTIIKGGLTQSNSNSKKQATFYGNIAAKDGLDIYNNNLTVKLNSTGSDAFTVDTNGNTHIYGTLSARGRIDLGNTDSATDITTGSDKRSAIRIGKETDSTTEILGKLLVDKTSIFRSPVKINPSGTETEYALEITGETNFKNTVYIGNNKQITLSTTGIALNGELNSTGNVSLGTNAANPIYINKSNGQNITYIYGRVAEGLDTNASGTHSHAEGYQTFSSGNNSHAEGSETQANGENSHAEGFNTQAKGLASHAEGMATISNKSVQHVFGEYNTEDTTVITRHSNSSYGQYIEIVGNGTDTEHRSNARTLDWNGNEQLAGKLSIAKKRDSLSGNLLDVGGLFTVDSNGNGNLSGKLVVDGSSIFNDTVLFNSTVTITDTQEGGGENAKLQIGDDTYFCDKDTENKLYLIGRQSHQRGTLDANLDGNAASATYATYASSDTSKGTIDSRIDYLRNKYRRLSSDVSSATLEQYIGHPCVYYTLHPSRPGRISYPCIIVRENTYAKAYYYSNIQHITIQGIETIVPNIREITSVDTNSFIDVLLIN